MARTKQQPKAHDKNINIRLEIMKTTILSILEKHLKGAFSIQYIKNIRACYYITTTYYSSTYDKIYEIHFKVKPTIISRCPKDDEQTLDRLNDHVWIDYKIIDVDIYHGIELEPADVINNVDDYGIYMQKILPTLRKIARDISRINKPIVHIEDFNNFYVKK